MLLTPPQQSQEGEERECLLWEAAGVTSPAAIPRHLLEMTDGKMGPKDFDQKLLPHSSL